MQFRSLLKCTTQERQYHTEAPLPCELLPAGDYYVTLRDASQPDASPSPAAMAASSRANFRVLRQ